MAVLDYLELPVKSAGGAKQFYAKAFDWNFTDYGPDYAAKEDGPCQVGLNGVASDDGHRTAQILPVIRVEDLKAARAAVIAAGGSISLDIFDFPGGQRFHFMDPEGLELGCYQPGG